MLKYDEIIRTLSEDEKIGILCDVRRLSDGRYEERGLPRLLQTSVESLGEGEFPAPDALANSWDMPLIRETAQALAERAARKNADLLTVPAPRARISPYRRALSEDPYLACEIARAYAEAADRAQIAVSMGGFGLHGDEPAFLDREPNERFLHEFLTEPYVRALADAPCAALHVFCDPDGGEYRSVNTALAETVSGFCDATLFRGRVSAEQSVSCLAKGQLFFEGSESAVRTAVARYRNLREAVSRGEETEQTLADAVAQGRALAPEALDAAMDRLLDFAFSIKRKHARLEIPDEKETALRAVSGSLVLLRNEGGLLPLSEGASVCLIGDIAFAGAQGKRLVDICGERLRAFGFRTVGAARGYRLDQTRNEDGISEAVALAEQADAVVLFLGNGQARASEAKRTGRITLPANQTALLDRLGFCRDRLTAVLPSDELWSLPYPDACGAIVTVPFRTEYGGTVLADALAGRLNPCGRLASAVRTDTETWEMRRRAYAGEGLKTGVFLGYRYDGTAGEDVGFPFGHGLGYTEFAYTRLVTEGADAVSVTVENIGGRKGTETVQVYAGKLDSAVVRPEKELVGFARAELEPGERKTVRIPIRLPEAYEKEKNRCVTEAGDYAIFVGASVRDLRLAGKITADGETLAPDGGRLNDYIHTKPNVRTHHYLLEANITTMKRSVLNWIAGGAAILMAAALKVYWTAMGTEPRFFAWFELILCLLGVWIFIAEAIHRQEQRQADRALLERENERLFRDAEQIPAYDAPAMFAQAFDAEADFPAEETDGAYAADTSYFADVDKNRDFASVAAELEVFARERGCKLGADGVRRLLASFASSRLLILGGMTAQDFRALLQMLSEYFDTAPYFAEADAPENQTEGIRAAIEAAKNAPASIHLVGISDVRCEDAEALFAPFAPYIANPLGGVSVRLADGSLRMPSNVWFVAGVARGDVLGRLPLPIALAAAVDTPVCERCPEASSRTQAKPFGYGQLEYLKEGMDAVGAIAEAQWKKMDLLEERVCRTSSFRIDNRLWLGTERFAYAYAACGGKGDEAIDEAAAARLLVPMAIVRGDVADGESLPELLDTVFGEDGAEACKRRAAEIGR